MFQWIVYRLRHCSECYCVAHSTDLPSYAIPQLVLLGLATKLHDM